MKSISKSTYVLLVNSLVTSLAAAAAPPPIKSSMGISIPFRLTIPATGTDNGSAIRKYLDSLPRLAMVQPKERIVRSMTGLPPGVTGTEAIGGTLVNQEAELSLLKAPADIFWPGALLAGASVSNNQFQPLIVPRSPGRVRLSTNFIGSNGGSQYKDLPIVGAGEVQDTIRHILSDINPTDSTSEIISEFASGQTIREVMVKLGVAYKAATASASLDAKLNTSAEENTIVAKFTQSYYRAVFDPSPDLTSPFINPSFPLEKLKPLANKNNPPLYVSEVKYGRIMLVQFTAKMDKVTLDSVVRGAYKGVISGSLESQYKEKVSKLKISFLSIGQNGQAVAAPVKATDAEAMIGALHSAVQSGLKYDPASNPGEPIAITMRYVGSVAGEGPYAMAVSQYSTQLSPDILSLASHEYCLPQRFSVWDGPGGGLINTHIDAHPGDIFRFSASGINWSGVALTGDHRANGWSQWEKPGNNGQGYPITNRSPFALIGKFGGSNNYGQDRTKKVSTDPYSDWFFIGENQQVTAGDEIGAGPLFLSTNDDNPYNGDANKKFQVQVCVTRKIYE